MIEIFSVQGFDLHSFILGIMAALLPSAGFLAIMLWRVPEMKDE